MKFREMVGVSISILLLLSGCSDPRSPSKSNFKAAIQAYLDTRPGPCVALPDTETPFRLPAHPVFSFKGGASDQAEALVAVGLLTSAPAAKRPFHDAEIEYQLSAAGTQALVRSRDLLGFQRAAFCTGKYRVKDVLNFTEPADFLGAKVSHVTLSYMVDGVADWVHHPQLLEVHPDLKEELDGSAQRKATVVLQNDGWVDARTKGL